MNIEDKEIVLNALHGAVFELKTTIKHHAKEHIYTMPIEETVKQCLSAIKLLEGAKDDTTQTFYVIKRDEESKYWYYLDTWDQSMERCFLSGDNLQSQIDYVRKNNPTARIVKVMVEEVEGE